MEFKSMKSHRETRLPGPFASPWLIIGGAVILGTIILAMTLHNLDRDGQQMAVILEEKGASLIKALEAGARTNIRSRVGSELRMQVLVEEMAAQPGILFIMVTDHAGRVLAHSDTKQQGAVVFSSEDMAQLEAGESVGWRIMEKSGVRAFVVYRQFMPLMGRDDLRRTHRMEFSGNRGMGGHMNTMGGHESFMNILASPNTPPPIIYVGMDVAPFERAKEQDTRHTLVMASILLLLGLAGFISLLWAQNVRRSRRMLEDTQALSAKIIASLPDGLILVDPDGRVAFLNEQAEGQLGLRLSEVRGRLSAQALPEALRSALDALGENGRMPETETECRLADGRELPLSITGARVVAGGQDSPGSHVGDILILRDLSEVRQLQHEVRRKEKLAAVGSLAAGVAHEIRNPLSSIKGYATYFGTRFPEGSEDREAARIMVEEVDRLNRVITDLISLSRPSDLKREFTDISAVAGHCLRLIGPDAQGQGVSLSLESEPNLPLVPLDPDRFSQALLNICLNGLEAMPTGGALALRIAREGDAFVRVSVSDTGPGVEPEAMARIFDPYFTTKSQGTGLGLAIVHKIIEAHGGSVRVMSQSGSAGASDVVRAPVSAASPSHTVSGIPTGKVSACAAAAGASAVAAPLASLPSDTSLHAEAWGQDEEGRGHGTTFSIFLPTTAPDNEE